MSRTWASALVRPCGRELVARGHELALGGRDHVALGQELEGEGLLALLERRPIHRLLAGAVAQAADSLGDLAVPVRYALEELRALEEVPEAVRLEHDREHVRGVGLVDLDETSGEDLAGGCEFAPQPSSLSRASSRRLRTSSSSAFWRSKLSCARPGCSRVAPISPWRLAIRVL